MNQTLPRVDWKVALNRAAPEGVRGWGRVRASQIDETCRGFTVAVWGQTVNAILLAIILRGHIEPELLVGWLLSLVALMMVGLYARHRWHRLGPGSVSPKAVERVAYLSLLFGMIWSAPPLLFFPYADASQQLAICMVIAGMMAGATFVFPTLPHAAGGYILIVGPSVTHMLAQTNSALITAIGPIYTLALLSMAMSNGRAFMQRRCTELALEDHSETVSLLLNEYESSDADWLWETNWKLALQNVSPRFARALGREVGDLEGRLIEEVLAGDGTTAETAREWQAFVSCLERHAPMHEMIISVSTPEGIRCIEVSARPRFNSHGRFIGYRGVGSDVTEARHAQDRITHMARHDALTGLPNRLQLHDALREAADKAARAGSRCAILLIDLDRFKTVNDTLGHVAGDHLLQQVSSRFEPMLNAEMMVGRLGGDEFALVIPRADSVAEIERICRDIIEAIKRPFIYNDQHLFVGASIGIAFGPGDGDTVEELIRNADLALYRAKAEGGNDLCFYEPSLHAHAEERRQIELAMRGALEAGEFRLVYQPVVDAKTEKVRSFEALLRWNSAEMGEVSPAKFIPLAEETGLIRRIGEWVLRTATAEAAKWPADVALAVNMSPLQLHDPGVTMTLVSALSQSGLDPRRLELEITETVFLQLTPEIQKVLHQIQALGVQLAIDDFGTGYSSLSYLRDSRFDTIKIDRSFISGLSDENEDGSAIVRAVVAMASSLGMETIAEGVETEDQMRIVRDLGCDKVQGYLVSRPRPGIEVPAMLTSRRPRSIAA